MKLCYFFIWSLLIPCLAQGQNYQLSSDPSTFEQEMTALLNDTNDPQPTPMASEFEALWKSKLSPEQKTKIIATSKFMLEQRMKRPQFESLVGLLSEATAFQDLGPGGFGNLISTLEQCALKQSPSQLNSFINKARLVVGSASIFKSSYNSLFINGGTVDFAYVEGQSSSPVSQEVSPEQVSEEDKESQHQEGSDWYSDWDDDSENWDTNWEDEEASENKIDQSAALISEDEPQPALQGALIKLAQTNLIFITKNDSASITNTSGALMPATNIFVGEGGRFDWSMAGLNPEDVYCELSAYNFSVENPYVRASNAKMVYKGKISGDVAGVFEFKSSSGKTRDNTYPRFISFRENINIQGIADKRLTYRGGFALRGDRVYSASLMGGYTSIEITGQHGSRLKVLSRSFQLQDSVISTPRAAVTILHSKDSIYHPAVQFRYQPQEHMVTILKDDGSFKGLAYSSSYFETDFTADMIKWNMDADSLDVSILSAKNKVPSRFESHEYYNDRQFDALVALYGFNPLLMAVAYARKNNTSEFNSDDMAKQLNQNTEKVKGAMRGLMREGFVDYNGETGWVKIKRKGFHFVLSKQDRKDYDNIMIPSLSPSKSNATLNLKRNEFIIRGIEKFYISELLDVHIRPKNQQIVLLENRDFRFDGFINAGNFQFMGREFRFNYDSFLIALPKIDSITFSIYGGGDNLDRDVKLGITNQLVETAGVLYINKPNNKSARRIYPQYPIFKAEVGAVVYFDGQEILDGIYDKSIYFTIPAFELDSASSSDPSVIKFKGVFTSGGIFPEFEEELTVMPDNSLGFDHKLPYVGFKTYNGTGTVYNKISMDKNGLRSSGKVDFLTTTLNSDDFVYYIDSVTTDGESAETKAGFFKKASFPKASVQNFRMLWFPKTDSMFITSKQEPFQLYDQTATLKGTTLITTDGFFADGTLSTRGSESVSKEFNLQEKHLSARNAKFEVKSSDPAKPALSSAGVSLNFDLENNYADIKSEVDGMSVLDFPFSQIRTSISEARWSLEERTISMKKPPEVEINQSYFYTTKPEMDSLVFNATEALYDIEKLEMQVFGVPFIKVADAKIVPDSNRVMIRENATLEKFHNARITLDTLNEYHQLYNGNISITARHAFSGDAVYQYINANRDTFEINFKNFVLVRDKKLATNQIFTVATGEIKESDHIYIMPSTLYKGDVTLYANRRILQMDGFIKLDLKNMPDNDSWLAHSSDSEVQDLVINVSEAVTETGQPLTSGINIDSDNGELYGTFISEKRSPADLEVFNAKGLFSYDSANSEYRVIDPNKVKGNAFAGNIFSYNDINTDIRFEGKLRFLYPTTKIGLIASGKGKGNLKDHSIALNTFQAYAFDIPSKAMELMASNTSDIVARVGAPPAKTDQTRLLYKVADAVGEKAALDYKQRSVIEFISLANVSSELARSLVLSNVNMKWSPEYQSWYSVGNLGVANILDMEVNGKLEGFLEIRKGQGADEFHLFFKASPTTYYYFGYSEGRLSVFSSNNEFNAEISKNSKISRVGIGEYAYTTTDMEVMLEFIDRFRRDYMNITEPYEINTFAEEEVLDEDFTTFEEDTPLDADEDAEGF